MTRPCAHPSCAFEGVHQLANGHKVCSAQLSVASGAENIIPPGYSERLNEQHRIDQGRKAWRKRGWFKRLTGRG